MKNNKWYVISTFVLGCIVINFAGRILSDRLQLPLWLDSFGTVTAAYVLGPFCAAMVGMTVNLTYGILYSWTNMFYAVVSAMVGITTGICVKKGFLKNLYGVLSTSFLIAVLSVTLSRLIICIVMVLRRISGETVLLSLWKKLDSTAFSVTVWDSFILIFLIRL